MSETALGGSNTLYYLHTGPAVVCFVVILNFVAILLISYSVTPRSARSCWRSGKLASSFSISWLPVLRSKEDMNWTLSPNLLEFVTAPTTILVSVLIYLMISIGSNPLYSLYPLGTVFLIRGKNTLPKNELNSGDFPKI